MVKGKGLGVIILFMFIVGFLGTSYLAAGEQEVPDSFVIKSDLFTNPTKKHIEFTHKKHNEEHAIACKECHHLYKDGKNVWEEGQEVKKCEACHTVVKPIAECSEAEKKLNLQKAFHDNCKGCHMELKKEKKPTGPIKCLDCHPK